MHAMNGNGPKGQSKGRGKSKGKGKAKGPAQSVPVAPPTSADDLAAAVNLAPADRDALLRNIPEIGVEEVAHAVRQVIPPEVQLRHLPRLVPEEWDAPTMSHMHLSPRGGIAPVPMQAIPSVIAAVGFTSMPAAILITMEPNKVGLGAYAWNRVDCTLLVQEQGQDKAVTVSRYCVQLGVGQPIKRVATGVVLHLPSTVVQLTIKQPTQFGWPEIAKASNIANVLSEIVPKAALSEIQTREDITATLYVHQALADKLLQQSGLRGTFVKWHSSNAARDFHILWLPESIQLDQAVRLAPSKGLVCKGKEPPHRLGARFDTAAEASAFATKHNFEDTSKYGRWRVQGLPTHIGLQGCYDFLSGRGWEVHLVEFFDSKAMYFLSQAAADDSPGKYVRDGLHEVPVHFKAVNGIAKTLTSTHRQTTRASSSGSATAMSTTTSLAKEHGLFLEMVRRPAPAQQTPRGDKRSAEKSGQTPEPHRRKEDGE